MPEDNIDHIDFKALNKKALSAPLVTHIYTADPSAHYFNGKIYIYIHLMTLMQARLLTIWEVILRWKITMLFPWTV